MSAAIRKPTAYSRFDAKPAGPALGAEIAGLDLAKPLSAGTAKELESALAHFGVLVFRDQRLGPNEQVALAEALGGVNANRFFHPIDGRPETAEVCEEPHQSRNIGGGWRTDRSYDLIPAKASIVYARKLPRDGGETLFASAEHAYDALSPGLKATLSAMRALHSNRNACGYDGDLPGRILNSDLATQDALHPVVFRHPLTRRRALYVNPGFTVRFEGWSASESAPLLNYLYGIVAREAYLFRLAWREGTLAIWDNRTTWHRAENDDPGERGFMHRLAVAGDPLTSFEEETG